MTKPVRIQLSRAKGFNLQAASQAANGLPALKCARPGRMGNPFNWQTFILAGASPAAAKRLAVGHYKTMIEKRTIPKAWEAAVDCYYRGEPVPSIGEIARKLEGRNGACWCGAGDRCHVDLQLAWTKAWFR
jgi:hypothetical protein